MQTGLRNITVIHCDILVLFFDYFLLIGMALAWCVLAVDVAERIELDSTLLDLLDLQSA